MQVQRGWQGDRRQVRLRWGSPPDEPVFVKQYDPTRCCGFWFAVSEHAGPDQLAAAHDICLKIAIEGFGSDEFELRRRYRQLVLRLLAMNRARLPEAFLRDVANQLRACQVEPAELLTLAGKELPGLLPEDPAPPTATDG